MIYLIIYLVGYVLAYWQMKVVRNVGNRNSWGDILASIIFSLLSWLGFIIFGLLNLKDAGKLPKIKPPKWL